MRVNNSRSPVRAGAAGPTEKGDRPLWQRVVPDFEAAFRAIERVEKQLRDFTGALDEADIAYAIIGGNAVAAWVSTVDADATRSTKDVDVLLRRADWERVVDAVRPIGLVPEEVLGIPMFVEEENPSPKRAVHVIFADEPVRSGDPMRAPSVLAARRSAQGFLVIELPELVKMKLHAFRLRDQVHLVDMLSIGLLDSTWTATLPSSLQPRFEQVLQAFEQEENR